MRLPRLILGWLLALCAFGAGAVALSPDEQAWVRSHGPVRVVLVPSADPFYRVGEGARAPSGYAIEMMDLIAQATGLTLHYVKADDVPQSMAMLADGRADLTPLLRMSPERAKLVSMPGTLIPLQTVLVTRRDATELSAVRNFEGRHLALLAGSVNDERSATDFPGATIDRYPTLREALAAVADGHADLTPTTLQEAVYIIESQLLSNLRVRRLQGSPDGVLGPGVALSEPLLASIVGKGLDAITPAQRAEVARRWLPQGTVTAYAEGDALLTSTEAAWVSGHGQVRAGFDAHFAPFTEEGPMRGMDGLGGDLLRAIAAKTGLRIVEARGGTFAQAYAGALGGELDVVVGMARNASRAVDFLFVGPWSTVPTAILMRGDDARRWDELDEMPSGSKVGVLREHFLLPRLRLRNAGLSFVELPTQAAVLDALARGAVDAAIGNSVVVYRLVEQQFTGRLQVTGVVRDGESELYFGVPRRNPELARILDRGLAAMSPAELAALNQRWLFTQVQPGLRWSHVLAWGAPVVAALLALLVGLSLANGRLRAANEATRRAHGAAVAATVARGRFVGYLAHELRGGMLAIASGTTLLLRGNPTPEQLPVLEGLRSAAQGLNELFETTLAHEKAFATGIELEARPQDLRAWWDETLAPLRLRARERNLEFADTAPAAAQPLVFDGARLAQVLRNLVGNAVRYTGEGRIDVDGRWDATQRRLRIEVRDTGPGIPEAERAHLFEPYAQGEAGRQARAGAGLGLAIARQIVEAMGGRISVGAVLPHGARFTFEVAMEVAA
ncbi:MAG: transporter substrate-binding domain-containing protein [Burkholderiales bacterium]|nr:transporter substrate-binding domain-containing protein [Burkholderiales bacterium]